MSLANSPISAARSRPRSYSAIPVLKRLLVAGRTLRSSRGKMSGAIRPPATPASTAVKIVPKRPVPRRLGSGSCCAISMLFAGAFARGGRGSCDIPILTVGPFVFQLAFRFRDKVGRQLANTTDGFAIEHHAAFDHGLRDWPQRPPYRRQKRRAEKQRRGADGNTGERVAFEHILKQSHSRLRSSVKSPRAGHLTVI